MNQKHFIALKRAARGTSEGAAYVIPKILSELMYE